MKIWQRLLVGGGYKFFSITVDNASSNDVIVKELSKQLTKWKPIL